MGSKAYLRDDHFQRADQPDHRLTRGLAPSDLPEAEFEGKMWERYPKTGNDNLLAIL